MYRIKTFSFCFCHPVRLAIGEEDIQIGIDRETGTSMNKHECTHAHTHAHTHARTPPDLATDRARELNMEESMLTNCHDQTGTGHRFKSPTAHNPLSLH